LCRLFDAYLPPKAQFRDLQKLNIEFRDESQYVGGFTVPLKDGIGYFIADIRSLDEISVLPVESQHAALVSLLLDLLRKVAITESEIELVTSIIEAMIASKFVHDRPIEKLQKVHRQTGCVGQIVVRTDLKGEHIIVQLRDRHGMVLDDREEGSSHIREFYKILSRVAWNGDRLDIFQKSKHLYASIDFADLLRGEGG
jgi:hypothetical protein